jgi:phenylpyruvate tautomerase PptA (4-oxalocrotonate tautomerase family)
MYIFHREVAMPYVRISLKSSRTPEQRRTIADAVHAAICSSLGVPEDDRFQIVETHGVDMFVDPEYLGVRRDEGAIFIEIHLSFGRTLERKKALYRDIAANLEKVGVEKRNVLIHLIETALENWSLGEGIAQYAEKRPAFI